MGNLIVDVVSGPRVEERPLTVTLGIRETVPFRTMLSNRDRLLAELIEWLRAKHLEVVGPFFLRLHVVDMAGLMDIEVGVVVDVQETAEEDERVRRGILPAGRYAALAYRASSLGANRMLHQWVSEHELAYDCHQVPDGDAFAARCEFYLTDPRNESRKTRWLVELAFLLQ
jgi:effector-binding domain-containing protein